MKRQKGDPAHPGAGRPQSRLTRATRSIGDKWLARNKPAPLEVMLQNMEHFHHVADEQLKKIGKCPMPPRSIDEYKELLMLLQSVKNNRHAAQECARDAAPYMHPKLQSIDVGQRDDKPWVLLMAPGDDKL